MVNMIMHTNSSPMDILNVNGQVTLTGAHNNIGSGYNKVGNIVICMLCELFLLSEHASVELFPVFSCRASLQWHLSGFR